MALKKPAGQEGPGSLLRLDAGELFFPATVLCWVLEHVRQARVPTVPCSTFLCPNWTWSPFFWALRTRERCGLRGSCLGSAPTGCVTLGKLLHFSEPQGRNGDHDACFPGEYETRWMHLTQYLGCESV